MSELPALGAVRGANALMLYGLRARRAQDVTNAARAYVHAELRDLLAAAVAARQRRRLARRLVPQDLSNRA